MKIDRRQFLLASAAAGLIPTKLPFAAMGSGQKPRTTKATGQKRFNVAGKKVTVYTTADNTNQRISATDTLSFKRVGQPKETQICVFVDPGTEFQTFLGIGGAL